MHFILKRCRDFEASFSELVERGKGGRCNGMNTSMQAAGKSPFTPMHKEFPCSDHRVEIIQCEDKLIVSAHLKVVIFSEGQYNILIRLCSKLSVMPNFLFGSLSC